MQDEMDANLRSLFEEQRRSLPEEPFLGNTLRLIEKRRLRRIIMQRLAYVPGMACCALLSPLFIKGSIALCGSLNSFIGVVNSFVNTSIGVLTAALCALLLFFFNRRQLSRFV